MGTPKRARKRLLDAREYFLTHQRTLSQSFNWAIEGLSFSLKTQRNMRIHFAAAAVVILGTLFFKLQLFEVLAVLFAIAMVITAELLNTAIEVAVDIAVGDNKKGLAKVAKDTAAAAVLVASANALFVGILVFFKKVNPATVKVMRIIAQSPEYLSIIALLIVFGITVVLKVVVGEGTPARGGWPSIHAALGGSLFTAISIISKNFLVGTLAFMLASLVFQARVEKEIHTWFEVVSGALLGIIVTILLFQLFYF